MKVLVACEESQTVTKAFRAKGHEAYSCDIQECSGGHPEWHIVGDAIKVLNSTDEWDLVIAHPPCTYLTNSGVTWLYTKNDSGSKSLNISRWKDLLEGIKFFKAFQDYQKRTDCRMVIENPIPHKYAREGFYVADQLNIVEANYGIGKYDQIIQPWQFGHGETKATCFWLYNVSDLEATNIVEGREQRLHKLPPSPERAKLRSKTYQGIADAMADQWG